MYRDACPKAPLSPWALEWKARVPSMLCAWPRFGKEQAGCTLNAGATRILGCGCLAKQGLLLTVAPSVSDHLLSDLPRCGTDNLQDGTGCKQPAAPDVETAGGIQLCVKAGA